MKIEDLPEVAVVFDDADEMDHCATTSRISGRTPIGPEMIHASQRAIDRVGSFCDFVFSWQHGAS
jgi:hypothetical protein